MSIWPPCSGCIRISGSVPFGTGRPHGTEQGMRAGDLELSFWVRLGLGASKWICCQRQSCSGCSCLFQGGSLPFLTNLSPAPLTPPLASYLDLASGAHHCTEVFEVAPKWPALGSGVGDGRQSISRVHRLEEQLRALGHCPVGGPCLGDIGTESRLQNQTKGFCRWEHSKDILCIVWILLQPEWTMVDGVMNSLGEAPTLVSATTATNAVWGFSHCPPLRDTFSSDLGNSVTNLPPSGQIDTVDGYTRQVWAEEILKLPSVIAKVTMKREESYHFWMTATSNPCSDRLCS